MPLTTVASDVVVGALGVVRSLGRVRSGQVEETTHGGLEVYPYAPVGSGT